MLFEVPAEGLRHLPYPAAARDHLRGARRARRAFVPGAHQVRAEPGPLRARWRAPIPATRAIFTQLKAGATRLKIVTTQETGTDFQ